VGLKIGPLGRLNLPKNELQADKRSRQEFLPSRHALAKLTKGSPADRTFGQYAKATPSGASAPGTYAAIQEMGELGIDPNKE
jgi:hypothetical protein